MRKFSLASFVLALAALVPGLPAAAAPAAGSPASVPSAPAGGLLFAVSEGTSGGGAGITDEQIATKYKPLIDVMQQVLGQPVRVKYVRDFRALEDGMKAGLFDLVIARPSDYPARGVRDYGYRAVTTTRPDGHCLLVVPKDSPYQSLADVKDIGNKRLILPEDIAYMTTFCTAELRDRGLQVTPQQTYYVREQAAIPFSLKNKLAQIGGIASYSGAAKRLEQDGLRVLHTSRAQPFLPLIASARITPDQVARLRSAMVALADTPQGASQLAAIGLKNFDTDPQPRLLALLQWLEAKTPAAR
ncbi:MAG: PhnD/SsuA/transferrin family substrate-binding protein [Burkholderiaceae bacterium]